MSKTEEIDKYIAGFNPEVQSILKKMRTTIKEIVPEAEETMGYGVPTFKLNGKNLIHYAAFKAHIGLYPGPDAIKAFSGELKPYETSKGTIRLPLDSPIPYDLIVNITAYCVDQIG